MSGQTSTHGQPTPTRGKRPARLRPVQIDVFAEPDASDDSGVRYWHEWKFTDKPSDPFKHGRVDLPEGDRYTLKFQFRDRSGRNLVFSGPGANAMWVTSGPVSTPPPCPSGPGNGGQISYSGPCTRYHLEVEDANSGDECLLKYALRFEGDPYTGPSGKQYPPYEYDPEIRNGGKT